MSLNYLDTPGSKKAVKNYYGLSKEFGYQLTEDPTGQNEII